MDAATGFLGATLTVSQAAVVAMAGQVQLLVRDLDFLTSDESTDAPSPQVLGAHQPAEVPQTLRALFMQKDAQGGEFRARIRSEFLQYPPTARVRPAVQLLTFCCRHIGPA